VLNPATPVASIRQVLEKLDLLLLMSVNPGFGGQAFIPYVLDKVRQARQLIDEADLSTRLEIDGGIKAHNIAEAYQAGADTFVVGSDIFEQDDYKAAITALKAALA